MHTGVGMRCPLPKDFALLLKNQSKVLQFIQTLIVFSAVLFLLLLFSSLFLSFSFCLIAWGFVVFITLLVYSTIGANSSILLYIKHQSTRPVWGIQILDRSGICILAAFITSIFYFSTKNIENLIRIFYSSFCDDAPRLDDSISF